MQNIKDFSECRRLENEVRAEPENAVDVMKDRFAPPRREASEQGKPVHGV